MDTPSGTYFACYVTKQIFQVLIATEFIVVYVQWPKFVFKP